MSHNDNSYWTHRREQATSQAESDALAPMEHEEFVTNFVSDADGVMDLIGRAGSMFVATPAYEAVKLLAQAKDSGFPKARAIGHAADWVLNKVGGGGQWGYAPPSWAEMGAGWQGMVKGVLKARKKMREGRRQMYPGESLTGRGFIEEKMKREAKSAGR